MPIDIRLADAADLPQLTRIYAQAVATRCATGDLVVPSDERQTAWFESHVADRDPIYVAELERHIIGYNYLSMYRAGRAAFDTTRETSFYVVENHQRQGIARRLMEHVLEQCPALKVRALITFVLAHNAPSIAFLRNYGFTEWGRLPAVADFDGRPIDHLILGRSVIA